MTLNETRRTSAKLKYAGAVKDMMSSAKQVSDVNTSNTHYVNCSSIVFLCCFVCTSCTDEEGGSPSV